MYQFEIKKKILEFRVLGLPKLVTRQSQILMVDRSISALIGVRRAGKSLRALQFAADWLLANPDEKLMSVCHLDFDNPILSEMTKKQLSDIPLLFLKETPTATLKTPLLFIFDEIYRIQGWEDFVVDISRNPHWKIIVTGSSAKSLRSDIATSLRGKSISTQIWPFSFSEFLHAKKCDSADFTTTGAARIQNHFESYLKWGGFPAVTMNDEHTREALLHEYFDAMLLRDIIERHGVSRPEQCAFFLRHLCSQMARPFTMKSAFELMKQKQYKTSRDSLRDYLLFAQDAFLFDEVVFYSDSVKQQLNNESKIYCVDWALANYNAHVWDGHLSRAFECLVQVDLKRRGFNTHYYKTKTSNLEVDFIVSNARGQAVQLIQVCYNSENPETLSREIKPLPQVAKYFGIKDVLIVAGYDERELEVESCKIRVVPAWKWLLR